eukprot:sb/3474493/
MFIISTFKMMLYRKIAPKIHKLSFSHFWSFSIIVDISRHRQGRDTKIWYPGYFLTLNTMQASISIHNAPIFLIGNYRYRSSGPDGTPRSSTKFCEKTRRATLSLKLTAHAIFGTLRTGPPIGPPIRMCIRYSRTPI